MNFNKRTSRTPLALASTAVLASLLLTGCGQSGNPGAGEPSASSTEESSSAPGEETPGTDSSQPAKSSEKPSENVVDQAELLKTNKKLSTQLGDDYVQGWIEEGKLHVSTTSQDQVAVIEAAGAVAHLVQYSGDELREAIAEIMKWQVKQGSPVSNSIHAYSLNPQTGGITLSVDESQLETIKKLIEETKPVGDIPVDFKISGGFATPATS